MSLARRMKRRLARARAAGKSVLAGGERALDVAQRLYAEGKLKEAVPYYQRAFVEEPGNPEVLYRAGLTLVSMRDYKGAAKFLREALIYDPDSFACQFNLGICYEASGEYEQAQLWYQSSIESCPTDWPMPWVNMGGCAYRAGEPKLGESYHDMALSFPEEGLSVEERSNRGILHLLRGNYRDGFRLYENRWKLPGVLNQSYVPDWGQQWDGGKAESVLVIAEQGIGDTLMMARFIPEVVMRAKKVTLLVQKGLRRLIAHSFPGVKVIVHGDVILPEDRPKEWIHLMSLPTVLGLQSPGDVPSRVPYLRVPPTTGRIKGAMEGNPKRLIGLCAFGNKFHMNDRDRSAPSYEVFNPLFELEDVAWVSLQEKPVPGPPMTHFPVRDMMETAAVVEQLDWVVTVDTAVAHLSGALGKPTILFTPTAPEWRWGLSGTTTPWYPSTHLLRRARWDEWAPVAEQARSILSPST